MHSAQPHNYKPAVVLLSGGLDSMVSAGIAREQGYALYALTIDYNQRHRIEIESARRLASELGCRRHVVLPLDLSIFGGSALTDDIDVPTGGVGEEIPVTYVPARNLVFLSLTLAWAETVGASDIFIGVNALDYSGYPDCRPEFIASFQETARLGTKIGTGFGVVLALLAIVGVVSFVGIGGVGEVISASQLRGSLAQREVDHQEWARAVNLFLTDDRVTELDVEFDPTQCGFGKWYNGTGRQQAEKMIPALVPVFAAIEKPHRDLHLSAATVAAWWLPAMRAR